MKYNIAFYCESIPFTDATCRLEHSLGGSETMLIGMARELARRGHRVYVFTKFEKLEYEGIYAGVMFYDHSSFLALMSSIEWDIFISLRMPNIMSAPVRAKARFLWNQDELLYPKQYMANLWQTDKLFMISEWQKEHYCEKLPEIESYCWVTRNGVDLKLIENSIVGIEKDPYKLIYISRPERGLEPLLQIFPRIRKHCLEVKLYCARYYSMYEPMPNVRAICENADRLMAETVGCEYLGNLSKSELYREIASSRLMVYPGVPNFSETACIVRGVDVQTEKGPIPIEEIVQGDMVLTHRGDYREVTATLPQNHTGNVFTIRTLLHPVGIRVTPEHRILAIKSAHCKLKHASKNSLCKPNCQRQADRHCINQPFKNYKLDWIAAEKLEVGDVVVYPRNSDIRDLPFVYISEVLKDEDWDNMEVTESYIHVRVTGYDAAGHKILIPNRITVDDEFMRLAGYFVSEGSVSSISGKVIFSFSLDEYEEALDVSEIILKLFNKKSNILRRTNCYQVSVTSVIIGRFLKTLFGQDSRTRQIPLWFLALPLSKQLTFLRTLWNGDGSISGDMLNYTTTSKKLAYQLRDLLLRFDTATSISIRRRQEAKTQADAFSIRFTGATAPTIAQWLGWKPTGKKTFNRVWLDDEYLYLPIQSIDTEDYQGLVYDLEVRQDHSFVCESITVHNCIAAMESQACGTPIICTNRGALTETVGDESGVKIDGNAYDSTYQAIFEQNVLNLLVDDERYGQMQRAGWEWVKKYDYPVIVDEWEQFFDEFFELRFNKRYKRIYENLLQHDDIVAANYLAMKQEMKQEFEECSKRLQYTEEQAEIEKAEYAKFAVPPVLDEGTGRFAEIIRAISEDLPREQALNSPLRILDFACGNGSLAVQLARTFPKAWVTGIDFSPQLIDVASTFAEENQVCSAQADVRVQFIEGSIEAIEGQYDVIVCGEFLEHCTDYHSVIDTLEDHLALSGLMVFTMPYGPFVELLERDTPRAQHRGHVIHWEWADVESVFSKKKSYNLRSIPEGVTRRGNHVGHWIVTYKKAPTDQDSETGKIDWEKKIRVQRPFEKLSVCMIARNCQEWIDLCMEGIVDIADEIIVATNGPDEDGTINKIKKWGAKIFQLPLIAPGVPNGTPPPGNFAWLRNESIKNATGDWIFWIDTDERLTYPQHIRKYLTDNVFNGYGLRQVHLTVDQPGKNFDIPIRIFRNGKGYKFYGCIHEHAEDGHDNPIYPSLEIPECDLAHYGYLTEADRRWKCLHRNFRMLELDKQFFPERMLTDVLYARDHINFALWEISKNNQNLTHKAQQHCWAVVRIYQNGPWRNNPSHIYFKLIFRFYQQALQRLQAGLEFAMQDESGNPMRFLSPDEFAEYSKAMIDQKVGELKQDYPHFPLWNENRDEVQPKAPEKVDEIPLPAKGKVLG